MNETVTAPAPLQNSHLTAITPQSANSVLALMLRIPVAVCIPLLLVSLPLNWSRVLSATLIGYWVAGAITYGMCHVFIWRKWQLSSQRHIASRLLLGFQGLTSVLFYLGLLATPLLASQYLPHNFAIHAILIVLFALASAVRLYFASSFIREIVTHNQLARLSLIANLLHILYPLMLIAAVIARYSLIYPLASIFLLIISAAIALLLLPHWVKDLLEIVVLWASLPKGNS